MNKRISLLVSALLCAGVLGAAPLGAKPHAGKPAVKKEGKKAGRKDAPGKPGKKGQAGTVAAVLKELSYVTEARPNLKAKTYKYMQSATWCTICNLKMPDMVKMYPEMRRQGIEIILISADDTPEKARAFMEKYQAPFPCVMRNSEGVDKLPCFRTAPRLPDIFTVSADGVLLDDGSMKRGRKD